MTQTDFPDLKIEHTPVTLRDIVQEKMREAIGPHMVADGKDRCSRHIPFRGSAFGHEVS